MRAPVRQPEPHFSQPVRQIVMMLIVLGLVVAGGVLAYVPIYSIFHINPWLNSAIFAVFVLGVLACFWQVVQLIRAVTWIESFAADRPGRPQHVAPVLLAPLAALLGARGGRRTMALRVSGLIPVRGLARFLAALTQQDLGVSLLSSTQGHHPPQRFRQVALVQRLDYLSF